MNKKEELSSKEKYDLRKKEKEQGKNIVKIKKKVSPSKIGKYFLYLIITASLIGGLWWMITLVPNLPPMTQENHSEDSPESHILQTKMPSRIQKHMLEHADGGTRNGSIPGVIIQYNCDDYECNADLISKLTKLVREYPKNVYLAPNNYDGKIILTKLGKRIILDNFDEEIIRGFVGERGK